MRPSSLAFCTVLIPQICVLVSPVHCTYKWFPHACKRSQLGRQSVTFDAFESRTIVVLVCNSKESIFPTSYPRILHDL